MASLVTLQTAIGNLRANLKRFDTQLATVSATALSIGATADTTGDLEYNINAMSNKIDVLAVNLSCLNGNLTS